LPWDIDLSHAVSQSIPWAAAVNLHASILTILLL
jgi:hypothetical protein